MINPPLASNLPPKRVPLPGKGRQRLKSVPDEEERNKAAEQDHQSKAELELLRVPVRRAEAHLHTLYQLRVVDRFHPHQWPGSAQYHWVLDDGGAAVIAADRGVEVKELPWRRERALALADSVTLAHRVGTNGFFTALLRDAKGHPDRRLSVWWSAWRCAEEWGAIVRPDGYGVWNEPGARVPLLLEYDRGTESGA
jgi:Replication-relaxation